ncbi:uncharacterized protein LOC107495575 isoform X2 [Arachis duranensis]|uniref:Uncharacterized protein LOC107495575 isoform X2 n=1 Tax=Arachis duranensis TaxID=130453 RepID=A0A6P4DX07_ARADU|nr:uncharacterized protein LOC107495575 isoform X2 [Arachis duranensis]
MKRAAVNSSQFCGSVKNSKLSNKYNGLLEDYLEIQKEYVSKKRKLKVKKQKRDILLEEVRFLRQRHRHLTKLHTAKVEQDHGPSADVNIHDVPVRTKESVAQHETNRRENVNEKKKLVTKAPRMIEKPPKKVKFIEEKSGKEKILWPDELALKL